MEGVSIYWWSEECIVHSHQCLAYFTYRRYHVKTSYVSNYAFFTLLHKWVHRGQTHYFEKLQ